MSERQPVGEAGTYDTVRASMLALVAVLFPLPVWIMVWRSLAFGLGGNDILERHQEFLWSWSLATAIVWGTPLMMVGLQWRRGVYTMPEAPLSRLIPIYSFWQAMGILAALPVLLYFAWNELGLGNWLAG
jgi:hypothetical protein